MVYKTLKEFEERWYLKGQEIKKRKITRNIAIELKKIFNNELSIFIHKGSIKDEKNLFLNIIKIINDFEGSLLIGINNHEKDHPLLRIILKEIKFPEINLGIINQ